jgi:hypothetical protein
MIITSDIKQRANELHNLINNYNYQRYTVDNKKVTGRKFECNSVSWLFQVGGGTRLYSMEFISKYEWFK